MIYIFTKFLFILLSPSICKICQLRYCPRISIPYNYLKIIRFPWSVVIFRITGKLYNYLFAKKVYIINLDEKITVISNRKDHEQQLPLCYPLWTGKWIRSFGQIRYINYKLITKHIQSSVKFELILSVSFEMYWYISHFIDDEQLLITAFVSQLLLQIVEIFKLLLDVITKKKKRKYLFVHKMY